MNTHCLSNASCALVYSDQKGCPGDTSSSPRLPFIVPMQRCVCDVNGDYWPTAPGSCAKLKVTMPDGSSLFTLLRCSTTACEDSSCVELMSWAPQEYPFTCKSYGTDSFVIRDVCTATQGTAASKGGAPMGALCGHPGEIPRPVTRESPLTFPVTCDLAPKCPESVLGDTRLEQTCCFGTELSHPLQQGGAPNTKLQAPGFCQPPIPTTDPNASEVKTDCLVRSSAPGWKGCACLSEYGYPRPDRVCTVSCEPPHCPLPRSGIPDTPPKWQTSTVPKQRMVTYPSVGAVSGTERIAARATIWLLLVIGFSSPSIC